MLARCGPFASSENPWRSIGKKLVTPANWTKQKKDQFYAKPRDEQKQEQQTQAQANKARMRELIFNVNSSSAAASSKANKRTQNQGTRQPTTMRDSRQLWRNTATDYGAWLTSSTTPWQKNEGAQQPRHEFSVDQSSQILTGSKWPFGQYWEGSY